MILRNLNTSIQKKLIILYVGGFLAFLLYFLGNFYLEGRSQRHMTELVSVRLPNLERAEKLFQAINTARTQLVQSAYTQNLDAIGSLESNHAQALSAFDGLIETSIKDPKDLKVLKGLRAEYAQTYASALSILQEVVAGLETLSAVQGKFQKHVETFISVENKIADYRMANENALRASIESANDLSMTAELFGILLALAGLPFGVVVFRVIRSINNELLSASQRLHEASSRILELSENAQFSSVHLANSSSQQAAAIQQSVASTAEMRSMLDGMQKHAKDALTSSDVSFSEARNGKLVIDRMREAVDTIDRSQRELQEVNELVQEIRSKTAMINDIVFKTQLLSFNAAIEAARAGEHGRGFAVVAEEVGQLANTSGAAAREIESMLEHSAKRIFETIERTRQKVEHANGLSRECTAVFDRITERTGKTKSIADFLSNASIEQYTGVQGIGEAMNDLDSAARATDDLAQSIARLSGLLKTESDQLASTVGHLNSLVHGDDSGEKAA